MTNVPASSDQSQELDLNINLICSSCTGDSFLRGVFYPSGTSYFGYTQENNGNWVNAAGGSCGQYFKVALTDLQSGSWSGQLKVKPDIDNPLYSGPGDYLFKVGRYTSGCGSPTWSAETTMTITGPTPTPNNFYHGYPLRNTYRKPKWSCIRSNYSSCFIKIRRS